MSEENTVGVATLYEIIDIRTGLVEPVNHDGSGDIDGDQDADFFCKKEDGTEVVFTRDGQNEDGAIFVNSGYLIRSRDTHVALNGVTKVEDEQIAEAKAELEAKEKEVAGVVTE